MLIVKIELGLIVLTPSYPPDCLQQKRSFAVLLAASPGKMEQATQQDRGSDVGRAEDIGLGSMQPVPLQVTVPESVKPSVPVLLDKIALTDAQFERWMASQSLPNTVDRPVASTSHNAAHDMSDSGDSTGDGDPLPALIRKVMPLWMPLIPRMRFLHYLLQLVALQAPPSLMMIHT